MFLTFFFAIAGAIISPIFLLVFFPHYQITLVLRVPYYDISIYIPGALVGGILGYFLSRYQRNLISTTGHQTSGYVVSIIASILAVLIGGAGMAFTGTYAYIISNTHYPDSWGLESMVVAILLFFFVLSAVVFFAGLSAWISASRKKTSQPPQLK